MERPVRLRSVHDGYVYLLDPLKVSQVSLQRLALKVTCDGVTNLYRRHELDADSLEAAGIAHLEGDPWSVKR